jgi:hypothetical protein
MLCNLLTTLLVICCVSTHAAETTPSEALDRAVSYLWSQQQKDGSWRSEQYAVMRSGQSLTPFVLHTLLSVGTPLDSDHDAKSRRAADFIVARLDEQGALGNVDPDILEYPVYSTAYAVLALKRFQVYQKAHGGGGVRRISKEIDPMASFLISAQFNETAGFTTNVPAYGGWGFDRAQQPGVPGHMDLAHTRRALQALNHHRHRRGLYEDSLPATVIAQLDDAFKQSQRFLAVVQKRPETLDIQPVPAGVERPTEIPFDGGFYFSPVVLQANKGRLEKDGNYWQSYATATCDGILALLAAGVPKDDERVIAAVGWLRQHANIEYPQGIPTDYPEPWGAALKYYHFAVRAEVYDALDFPAEEKRALAEKVAALQESDGSFVNFESPLMKEDEPLLATALAVIALTHCAQ